MNDLLVPPDLKYLKRLQPSGTLHLSEGLCLCWLASQSKAEIVEIGSYMGKSTCYLASGSRWGKKVKVNAIDPWDLIDAQFDKRSPDKMELYAQPAVKRKFDRQTRHYRELINPIRGYSIQAAQTWDKPIGLLFIDGNHYQALEDYEAWINFVIQDGVVAFHDIDFPHVESQIREIQKQGILKQWVTINRLAYAVKHES